MDKITNTGELLLPGQIGQFSLVLAFTSAILAAAAYFFSTQYLVKNNALEGPDHSGWRRIGRWAFITHGLSIATVMGCIFYVMINKRFEYYYAHSHTDTELPFRYVFAAFWEGQEGSFLLWLFWHSALGFLLIWKAKDWESPVLSVLSTVQIFLTSMILGMYFGFGDHVIKWGSNPTLLLKNTMGDIPLFSSADYAAKLALSAKGLNKLLQNYWMTIHPPTLFLGFASTSIPFCYAIAGLWTKRYTQWLKPVAPWALMSASILGTGILMGGAWAYEALSFGGYWAWDPVENMSLVPWLVLVAGVHANLIARSTGYSIRSVFIFYILTFLLVLYSTFLTRSGILGDTSVHAFTKIGLESQLVILQFFFLILAVWMLARHYKHIPAPVKEESATSKEFWMFIGTLVLLFSAILITFTTSIPVYNKILGAIGEAFHFKTPHLTTPVKPVAHYNRYQLWIGVFVGVLSASAQFFRYKEFNFTGYRQKFLLHFLISAGISLALTAAGLYWIHTEVWRYKLLLFAGIYAVVANVDYAVAFMRKDLKSAGSAVSHIGFGLMIVGILASGVNKSWISHNRFAMEGLINFNDEQMRKNILLPKGIPMFMSGYEVTYGADTTVNDVRTFDVQFKKKDKDFNRTLEEFSLHPYIQFNKDGKIAATNPSTKHYWNTDIFSDVSSLPPSEMEPKIAQQEEDSLKYAVLETPTGDSVISDGYVFKLESLNMQPVNPKYKPLPNDVAIGVRVKVRKAASDTVYYAEPLVLFRDNAVYNLPATVNQLDLRLKGDPAIFERLFQPEESLGYKEYVFQQGEKINIGSDVVQFTAIDPKPNIPNFKTEPGDLSFGANFTILSGGKTYSAQPIYLIRGTQPIPIKDDVKELGLHFRIAKVDPETRKLYMLIAHSDPKAVKIPFAFAQHAPRADYIVIEAIVFPGINFFWIGASMMMFGLLIAMFRRITK